MTSFDKRANIISKAVRGARRLRRASSSTKNISQSIYDRWIQNATPKKIPAKQLSSSSLMGLGVAAPVAGYGAYKGIDAYGTNERKNEFMSRVPALMGAAGIGLLAGAGAEYGLSRFQNSRAAKEAAVRYMAVLDKIALSPLMKLGLGAAAGTAGVYGITQIPQVKKFNRKIDTGNKIFDIADKVMPYAPIAAGVLGAGLGAAGSYYGRRYLKNQEQQRDPVFFGQGY